MRSLFYRFLATVRAFWFRCNITFFAAPSAIRTVSILLNRSWLRVVVPLLTGTLITLLLAAAASGAAFLAGECFIENLFRLDWFRFN